MESTANLNQRRGGTFFCLSLSAFVSSRCLSGITGVLFTRGSGFVWRAGLARQRQTGGGSAPEGQSGDSFAGASLSPGGTCVAALPTRRSQARRAETDFTAVQRAGACALSDVLTGSWSERREINI